MSTGAPMGSPPSLAEQLAERTGLARIIALGVVKRACARTGTSPERLTRSEVPRVVEAIEPLLAVYLPPAEAAARVADLRRLAHG